ncbi:MAG: hydroxymethylglutaryl-CoA reductase [Candidatus Woesebacteria bacterium]|nr:hydroxymethylglutaryl-CoA reductase [Candidatus Woesebacteria bacterium]
MDLRGFMSVSERRKALEKHLKIDLKNIGTFSLDESVAGSRNCENMIGITQIPLGISSSIKINSKSYFVPLTTTEGALVASVSRGCKAISLSGGTAVIVEKVGVTRGPVFKTGSLAESFRFRAWLIKHFNDLNHQSVNASSHLKLLKIDSTVVGKNIYVRFSFDTDDAMGMNMATIATQAIVDFIGKKTKIKCLSISGNYCIDKKPSWLNFIGGRGFKVWAEVTLTKKVLREVLKTSAKKFFDVWLAKCMTGSALAGSMGFNAQFVNIVAAIFLAMGQDPAHIVEGSLGITSAEVVGENLYVSIYLPDLMIGTVGGGTSLATQAEALSILGINGGDKGKNAEKLAQIIGGTVLAGEISLLASLAEGSLVKAHKKLGRGEKI